MKRVCYFLLVAVLIFCGLSACDNKQSKLIGKWVSIDDDTWEVEFTANSISFGDFSLAYTIENGAIKTTYMGTVLVVSDSFEFVDNDTLKFIGEMLSGTFKRIK